MSRTYKVEYFGTFTTSSNNIITANDDSVKVGSLTMLILLFSLVFLFSAYQLTHKLLL